MDGNPPLFLPAATFSSGGNNPESIAVADVNGDGKPDVVVANADSGTVGVLLGNGDGTFQPAVTYSSGGLISGFLAVADVNGDGKPDIVVSSECISNGNCANGLVSVLLGNGDGTFQPAVSYNSGGTEATGVAVADVNHDGKPDLVVANFGGQTVGVLLGNGDGTFQPAVTYSADGEPYYVAVADVNGDGNPDLLLSNPYSPSSENIVVLLGNGNGTFQPPATYGSGGFFPASIAVADLNGDGKLDLAVANCGASACNGSEGVVGVLLGNGDGTFQPAVNYDSGGSVTYGVAIADVNGDGKPDILVTNFSNTVAVLLGNGDGTFQAALTFSAGAPVWIVVSDVNGDGLPDVVVASQYNYGEVGVLLHTNPTTTTLASSLNPSAYGQSVTFTAAVTAASGTPTGTVIFYDGSTQLGSATLANGSASLSTSLLAAGSHSITAAYQGAGTFQPSTSAPLNQVVNRLTTTTSLASSANPARAKERVTYSATVTSQYGGAATGTMTFQDNGVTVATVTLSGNQAPYVTSYSTNGVHLITATYSGDSNNAGSVSPVLIEDIGKPPFLSDTTLATSGSPSQLGHTVTFAATVTSKYGTIPDGELVTFYDGTTEIGTGTTASGVATFTTSSLTAKKHTIKATYVGDAQFKPSTGRVTQVVDK
jgi:hypothetical protein